MSFYYDQTVIVKYTVFQTAQRALHRLFYLSRQLCVVLFCSFYARKNKHIGGVDNLPVIIYVVGDRVGLKSTHTFTTVMQRWYCAVSTTKGCALQLLTVLCSNFLKNMMLYP